MLAFSNDRVRHDEESVARAVRNALIRAGHHFD
jgi:hypothetical protein